MLTICTSSLYFSKTLDHHIQCSLPLAHQLMLLARWLQHQGFPGGLHGKESACQAGELGSIPGSGRCPGEGNGNPLQYSCLENPMDRGAWWATVHGVSKRQTQPSDPHFHTLIFARFIRHYYVPGADMAQGLSAAWMSAGRRAKTQGQKPKVIGSISFFSLLSPFPLTPWTPSPPTSHTPATATLASTLPGIRKVSSPKSRAVLPPFPFSFFRQISAWLTLSSPSHQTSPLPLCLNLQHPLLGPSNPLSLLPFFLSTFHHAVYLALLIIFIHLPPPARKQAS